MDIEEQISELPELKDAPIGHKCRIEITVEKTKEGLGVVDAKYIGDAGKKSKEEYMALNDDAKDQYDRGQMEAAGESDNQEA